MALKKYVYQTSTKYCRYIRTEVYSAISLGFPDTPDYPEVVSIVDEKILVKVWILWEGHKIVENLLSYFDITY